MLPRVELLRLVGFEWFKGFKGPDVLLSSGLRGTACDK